jgi:hypothetical protein
MIISAGMLMKEAGLVPSIIELNSREPKATPIPMALAAFIASYIGLQRQSLNPAAHACTN